ncbi:hypothetical protein KIH24_13360 [Rhizobiales bacterium TNE-4]|nr:hypothetical protein [Rhizobiales bacterium TNE-4]MBV1828606.1 hypothetical protein [Rhizobiales bacterium TNE-4]
MARIQDGDHVVIDPYSAGDVFQTLTLMDHFKRFHRVRRLHFICLRRAARVICLFNNIDSLLVLNAIDEEKLALLTQTHWYAKQSSLFVAPPELHIDGFEDQFSMHTNYMKLKKYYLSLPDIAHPVLPPQNESIKLAAESAALRQGIVPNSVIVFNHAHTIKPLMPDVYLPLRDIFGENIFFDNWSNAPNDWGRRVDIKFEEIPYFCNLAGTAICIRSGITDVLSMSNSIIHTIYPGGQWMAPWFKDKNKVANSFRSWGIRDLGLNPNAAEQKIFIENGDDNEIIGSKILSSVISHRIV